METMYENNKEMIGEKLRDALYYYNKPSMFFLTDKRPNNVIMVMVTNTKIMMSKHSEVELVDFNRVQNPYDIVDSVEDIASKLLGSIAEKMEIVYTDNDLHSWSCDMIEFLDMIITSVHLRPGTPVISPNKALIDTVTVRNNKSKEWTVFMDFADGGNNIRITISQATITTLVTDNNGKVKMKSLWWKNYDIGQFISGDLMAFLKPLITNEPEVITASLLTELNTDKISNVIVPITLKDLLASITDLYLIVKNN